MDDNTAAKMRLLVLKIYLVILGVIFPISDHVSFRALEYHVLFQSCAWKESEYGYNPNKESHHPERMMQKRRNEKVTEEGTGK